jgi:hypothetical protein
MLDFKKTPVKRTNVGKLHRGNVILYRDELYMFDRIPNGARSIYTIHMETLKSYKIPITNGGETYYDVVGFKEGGITKPQRDTEELVKGDLFALDYNKQGSYIFRFERYTNSSVVAINPMNNKEVRISKHMNLTKIENMPF